MPFPRDLVRAVSKVLGLPEETVVQHDRQLAEHGYRRSGGRGRSAARVTADDVANLLVAVMAAPIAGPTIRNSVATFEKYAFLPAWISNFDIPGEWSNIAPLAKLPKGHTLISALSAIITESALGRFSNVDEVWGFEAEVRDPGLVGLSVEFNSPSSSVTIRISGHRTFPSFRTYDATLTYNASMPHTQDELELRIRESIREPAGDLRQIRVFGEATFSAIASLFQEAARASK